MNSFAYKQYINLPKNKFFSIVSVHFTEMVLNDCWEPTATFWSNINAAVETWHRTSKPKAASLFQNTQISKNPKIYEL